MSAISNGENGKNTVEKVRVLLFELDYLKQENINLKNGLSRALQGKLAGNFVEKAEEFQQMFINKDQVIDLFRHEVSTLMVETPPEARNGKFSEKVVEMQQEIEVLIACFWDMKTAFEKYLSEI
ncbi:hypothetical protein SAMN05216327_102364 [Dyadobacter sp. SG02]|uniref:hypothetical protein n=1 Tax=Dyadobacter sp. SG02 TaxID=1855291 RepID=UPI0008D09033|nr:hypothetical protein [Dyadobacter sp. SG02]SEI54456.1 hypothetical protein SAMN05216327_102364 [Dyadobacter sp. SG02]